MSKVLVTYFSASGVTRGVAQNIADSIGADLFEIRAKQPYTEQDINWHDKNSRSSIEMNDKSSRPEIEVTVSKLDEYETILIGFPVWWYTAPTIINTFIESLDLSGKTLIPFCTSGGTGISGCERDLRNEYPEYNWKEGKRFTGNESKESIKNWIGGLNEN